MSGVVPIPRYTLFIFLYLRFVNILGLGRWRGPCIQEKRKRSIILQLSTMVFMRANVFVDDKHDSQACFEETPKSFSRKHLEGILEAISASKAAECTGSNLLTPLSRNMQRLHLCLNFKMCFGG